MKSLHPIVFLDRDGVICEERSYVTSLNEMHIFPYAEDAVRRLHALGYLAIIITNQSAIARGLIDEASLSKINKYLIEKVGVDAVYYCPHLPPEDNAPERPPYRIRCNCRKPRKGLIERAVQDFSLNLADAWFVGDRASDIETGQAAGIRTVLLESGYGSKRLEKPVKPDLVFDTLLDFVDYLGKERTNAVPPI